MDKRTALLRLIPEQGIVPLYYSPDPGVSIELMRALYRAGIRTTEYADRGDAALRNFREMRGVCDAELPGMYLGIGTIKDAESARKYIDAGAEFLVCPGILPGVVELSDQHSLLCIPGCMTPTEIIGAESLGCTLVKLFPANTLTPGFVDAIQAIFPGIRFLPTGGIELDEDNLRAWFGSGVCAVGGSKMITKGIIDNRQYEELTLVAGQALERIAMVRHDLKPQAAGQPQKQNN